MNSEMMKQRDRIANIIKYNTSRYCYHVLIENINDLADKLLEELGPPKEETKEDLEKIIADAQLKLKRFDRWSPKKPTLCKVRVYNTQDQYKEITTVIVAAELFRENPLYKNENDEWFDYVRPLTDEEINNMKESI